MSNTPHIDYFLDIVAKNYVENEKENLSNFCFVFPNKRSGLYFRMSLRKQLRPPYLEPEVTTISDFVTSFSHSVVTNRYELLFILYNCYVKVMNGKESTLPFDKFAYWGDILLNDFDEINKNLVDAKMLFVNQKRWREIESDYLTAEQKEILKFYFGDGSVLVDKKNEVDAFWKHTGGERADDDGTTVAKDKFVAIWEVLWPLYEEFHRVLEEKKLSYGGLDYRNAAASVCDMGAEEFDFSRYIFVGFNAISKSEIKIFRRLNDLHLADFCWDYNSPAFKMEENHANRFMRRNVKVFESRYDCNTPEIKTMPRIRVVGMGSEMGMVKSACGLLRKHIVKAGGNGEEVDYAAASRSALVLPDENLLLPVVNSLYFPRCGEGDAAERYAVNITMGFPLSKTPVAALIHDIARLHFNSRKTKTDRNKADSETQTVYFVDHVASILSNPLVRDMAGDECDALMRRLRANRIFNVPQEEFEHYAPSLRNIFRPISDLKSTDEVFGYLIDMTADIANLYDRRHVDEEETDPDSALDQSQHRKSGLNELFLNHYRQVVVQMWHAAKSWSVDVTDERLLFRLIDRAVSGDSINFTGEPIGGLQILGILETRAINFSDVYILSMNEQIFPRKHFSRSFIPDAFRRAYFLPTINDQEAMSAYYFYRLISRADNVWLYYVAASKTLRRDEQSRYISQLQYLFPDIDIASAVVPAEVSVGDNAIISVDKHDENVERELERLRIREVAEGEKMRNISPSAIKDYLSCRLKFYLAYVKGLRVKDEVVGYISDPLLGTILHAVMERIYKPGESYDQQRLNRLAENRRDIERMVTQEINRYYLMLPTDRLDTDLEGEERLVGNHIANYVVAILNAESQSGFLPFEFKAAEKKAENTQITISKGDDSITFNVRQAIDRIDTYVNAENKQVVRIVDYKTGGDVIKISGNDLASAVLNKTNNAKAFFQLLFYCEVYRQLNPDDTSILKPVIYKVSDIVKNHEISDLTFGGKPVDNYEGDGLREATCDFLYDIVSEIFNPNVPFDQSSYVKGGWKAEDAYDFDADRACKYCKFKFICNKKIKE